MSIKANFYLYSKTIDSTARPSGSGTEFDIVLKDAVTITAPVIELSRAAIDYNYCYIPAFGRYYFVQSATILTNDIIEYSLSEDVLATWRSSIFAASCYVLRSASDYNVKLVDDTWTHTTDFSETVTSVTLPQYDATGCYIITAVNAESASSANPASTMYVMNDTGLALLCSEMFDLDNYINIDDLTATYFNPGQYITSAKWLPFSYNSINSAQGTPFELIKYGWYTAKTAGGYRVTQYGKTLTFSITIGSYTDWTDRDNNWTRYALYVPGFGVTEIDAAYSGQTLTGKISIDFNTGNANLMLTTGSGQVAAQLSGKVGADVAINQVGGSIDIPTSGAGAISKGIQFAGAFAGQGGFRSGAHSVVEFFKTMGAANAAAYGGSTEAVREHMANAMNSGRDAAAAAADAAKQVILNPTVSTSGSDGARYTIIDNHSIYLYRRKYSHYNPAVSKLGGVCNQVKTLGDLSGYTQVANGLIEMTGTVEERNAITSLLEGGFVIA